MRNWRSVTLLKFTVSHNAKTLVPTLQGGDMSGPTALPASFGGIIVASR